MKALIGILCGLVFNQAATATALDKLRGFLNDTKTARAQFTQTVVDKNGKTMQQSSGSLSLSRPGKFRWSYDKPYQQLLVGDGQKVWIYDPDLNQVTVKKLDQALGNTPALLLAGGVGIEQAFELKELPLSEGLSWIEAIPRNREGSFAAIQLGFNGSTLVKMKLKDNFGQTSLLNLMQFERNPPLDSAQFQFTPPKGADVIGD